MSETTTRATASPALLGRLTQLSQELAGAFRPATAVELLARALTELLAPDRLIVVLLDADTSRLAVASDSAAEPAATDDPLIQLALRSGPLLFERDVAARARELGVALGRDEPAAWIGAPLAAAGRPIGAVSLTARRAGAFSPAALTVVRAAVAQATIALENARLLELLSSAKRSWEETVDAITQAICIIDAQGVVRRANRVFADLVRTPVTGLPGRPWLDLLPPAWVDPVGRAVAERAQHPAPIELRAGERTLLCTVIALADAGAAVLVFEDQTEKRQLQDQLIQSEKMSAIGQLIAGVAHDLNNPLASVVGLSDFLAETGEVPAALSEPLHVIRQEAERAATIVKNLLSFARSQEGGRKVQDLKPVLDSTLALLHNELLAHHVSATLEIEDGLPNLEINANQIQQVFVNLIANAAQAIAGEHRPGRITVGARRWLDGVAVSVTDTGPGIPDDFVARVFEPFFTTKGEGQGTGLGLSICQGIVKEHGGRLTLETRSGAGATFTVELPGAAAGVRVSAPVEPARDPHPLRVLVVDDEPHILYYMRSTLESWGHTVDVATDGAHACERALGEPFDVIICDLRMPHVGGREMYHRLTHEHPIAAARIVFATGDTVRGDTLHFLEGLGRPYLKKPFTLDELRRVLARVAPRPA
ncbi:MAG TPA: ATP-binding protein [Gemmatimonadales bacterium]|nr:ATP-binding protein [Gemmatimonadales bacterium]